MHRDIEVRDRSMIKNWLSYYVNDLKTHPHTVSQGGISGSKTSVLRNFFEVQRITQGVQETTSEVRGVWESHFFLPCHNSTYSATRTLDKVQLYRK